jgi:hypothetical protein
MIMDRRTFIQRAALVAATPAIAALFPLPSPAQSDLATSLSRLSRKARTGTDPNSIVFKIDGWDCGGDTTLDQSSMNMVLIRINR